MRRVAKIVTPAATTPVTLAEVKAHCRVTFSDDDTILAVYLSSAVSLVEHVLQRKLINQTWKMWLDYWPASISPLFGNLQSVTHIKYTDSDGAQSTLAATEYDVDINSVPGRVLLKDGKSWPADTLHAVNPIEVQFVTGYGATVADVPSDIRNAILLTVSHFYENRENVVVAPGSFTVEDVPGTAQTLLQNHRVWEWIL